MTLPGRCPKCARSIVFNSQIQSCGYTTTCPYKQARSFSDESTSFSSPAGSGKEWSVDEVSD